MKHLPSTNFFQVSSNVFRKKFAEVVVRRSSVKKVSLKRRAAAFASVKLSFDSNLMLMFYVSLKFKY